MKRIITILSVIILILFTILSCPEANNEEIIISALEAYLKAPNNTNIDLLGENSIAIDGDTLVVGVCREDSATNVIINSSDLTSTNDTGLDNGAVYVFRRTGITWALEAYLKPPNNTNQDYFGNSVSINNDTIVVGSISEDSNTTAIINGSDLSSTNNSGFDNGAVYVFKRTGITWALEAYLKAPITTDQDRFGNYVAIDSDTIIVGSHCEDSSTNSIINGNDLSSTNDSGTDNGAAYVFKRTNTTWAIEAYLKAPNTSTFDSFGEAVAIDGDTIIVGACNEDSTTDEIINGSDLSSTNDSGVFTGAVYVFKRTDTTWTHEAYLKAPNTTSMDVFGSPIAINGDTVVVGVSMEDSATNVIINSSDLTSTNDTGPDSGAVYVFKRSGTIWSHEAYLKSPNLETQDFFGSSVDLNGDIIVVGATGEDSNSTEIIYGNNLSSVNDLGNSNGAAYIFKRSGTNWIMKVYCKAPNTSDNDFFGSLVAVSNDIIAIAAFGEDSTTDTIINGSDLSSTNDSGDRNGAVYVFH